MSPTVKLLLCGSLTLMLTLVGVWTWAWWRR